MRHDYVICFCEVIHCLQWKWQLKASNSADLTLKRWLSGLVQVPVQLLVAESNFIGTAASFFFQFIFSTCKRIIRTLCS